MRTITMIEIKDGKLSGEVKEDGHYWQIMPFAYAGKQDKEVALLGRLDIMQIEEAFEIEMGGDAN